MAFDKDAFLTALDSMSVMDLNELVKAIEVKFGVSAAAMSAPAAGGGGGDAELLFDRLDEGVQVHHRHGVECGQECVFIECHFDFQFSM